MVGEGNDDGDNDNNIDLRQQAVEHINRYQQRFGDAHKRFLQAMLDHGIVEVSHGIKLFEECIRQTLPADEQKYFELPRPVVLQQVVDICNPQLQSVGFRLLFTTDECDGTTEYLCLASQLPYSKQLADAAVMTEQEVALFNKWLEVIMGDEAGAIDSTEALNKWRELPPGQMTADKAQKLAHRLVEQKWICHDGDDSFRLHQRAIIELDPYLCKNFGARRCSVCKRLLISVGLQQQCDSCKNYLHTYCLNKLSAHLAPGLKVKCPAQNGDRVCNADITVVQHQQAGEMEQNS